MARSAKKTLNKNYLKTATGHWRKDPSGLWHYKNDGVGNNVSGAADNAIREPAPGPAWFWFNDTPAPIYVGDTTEVLVQRWQHWRVMIQHQDKLLLPLLAVLSRE